MSRSDNLAILIAVILTLTVCISFETLNRKEIVVDTRGISIVRVVIEGPGGDLVPVEYEPITDTAMLFDYTAFASIALGLLLGLAVVFLFLTPKRSSR